MGNCDLMEFILPFPLHSKYADYINYYLLSKYIILFGTCKLFFTGESQNTLRVSFI